MPNGVKFSLHFITHVFVRIRKVTALPQTVLSELHAKVTTPSGSVHCARYLRRSTIQLCFRLDLSLGLKGDDVIKHVTQANCFYICSFRTIKFTCYGYLNYSFEVGHRLTKFGNSCASQLLLKVVCLQWSVCNTCMFILIEDLGLQVMQFDAQDQLLSLFQVYPEGLNGVNRQA